MSVAVHRTRKNKENPHYEFLVSWQPKPDSQARVKRESKSSTTTENPKHERLKNADLTAQQAQATLIKKDIFKSLILVSFILIVELVVYLAWRGFHWNLFR